MAELKLNNDGFFFFTYKELTQSDTAVANKIGNIPNATEKLNLKCLVQNMLDPIRIAYGSAMNVSSGFRNEAINKLVGGSPTSNHRLGYAADVSSNSEQGAKAIYEIAKMFKNFDEVYLESRDVKDNTGKIVRVSWWVHIAYKNSGNRNKVGRLHNDKFI